MPAATTTRWPDLAALALVLAGCGLRLHGLTQSWLSPDEGINWSIATRALPLAIDEMLANTHPPGWYVLLRLVACGSDSLLALRLPALGCGTAAIWCLYRAGKSLAGPATGLVAALLLALSPQAITQSQLLRPYAALVLLLALGLRGLAAFASDRRRGLGLYATTLALAVTLHYGTAIVLAGGLVATATLLLLRTLARPQALRLALAHLPAGGMLLLLYALHVRPHLSGSAVEQELMRAWMPQFFADSPRAAAGLLAAACGYVTAVAWAGGAMLALLVGTTLACRGGARWLGVFALSALGVALAASSLRQYPLGCTRHVQHLAPLLLLALAHGLVQLGRRVRTAPVLLVVLLWPWLPAFARELLQPAPARLHLTDEHPVSVADHERVARHLLPLCESPGLLVLDLQSYYLIAPDLGHARDVGEWHAGWYSFRWGHRDVVLHMTWRSAWLPNAVAEPRHIVPLLQAASARFPQAFADLRCVAGGWIGPFRQDFAILGNLARPHTEFLFDLVETRSLNLFRLDGPRFLAAYAATLRR